MVDLKEYPLADELRERLTTAAEMDQAIADADLSIAFKKASIECDICAATNDAGKPLYSNEGQRNAATTLMLAENADYISAIIDRRAHAFQRAIALAEAEAIKKAIQLACATARVGAD